MSIVLKLKDVYSFFYNEEYKKTHMYPNHCFDGQLIVKESYDTDSKKSSLILVDTYWSSDNKWFTLEKALQLGTLTLKCNMDDVVDAFKDSVLYYKPEDCFNLSTQHGCYKKFVIKKGATRDKNVMLEALKCKLDSAECDLRYTKNNISDIKENINKVSMGNLKVYV